MREWKQEIRNRLASANLSPLREAAIIEELSQHLEDRYNDSLCTGKSEGEAYRIALASLNDDQLLTNELNQIERQPKSDPVVMGLWRKNMISDIWQDIRYGIRMLKKNPGFTLVAVLTLALGIGANTAIFSVVNAVLLRPLPFPEPDRIVTFIGVGWSHGLFAYNHDQTRTLQSMAAYQDGSVTLTGSGEPERLGEADVTVDFFKTIGWQPAIGRTFTQQEDSPDNNNVVILSHRLWQRRFGGDSAVLGKSITLNNNPYTVIGVMPQGFDFPDRVELWLPVGLNPQWNDYWNLVPIGRLKPNVTLDDASRESASLRQDYSKQQHFRSASTPRIVMVSLKQSIAGDARTPLLVLLGAVGLVLLIACANVANLLLARATSRNRELAVRSCLGASSRRIVRQLLTESVLLALIGTAGGLFLAFWAVQAIKHLSLAQVPRIDQVSVDPVVLLFTLGIALVTGLLFGLVPAIRASRINLQEAIKEGSRGSSSGATRRVNNIFVIAQFSMSLVLLVGAGLLLQSFRNLMAVNPGFRQENVLVGRVDLPETRYRSAVQIDNFYGQLLERASRLPGVNIAGLGSQVPLNHIGNGDLLVFEGRETTPNQPIPVGFIRRSTPGYPEAMGIPLLSGRTFELGDSESSLPVAIIDDNMARTYWPNENPIGKRLRTGGNIKNNPWLTVVGVVASVKKDSLDEESKPYLYRPFSQDPRQSMYVIVRSAGNPENLIAGLRSEVRALDSEIPLFDVHTMEQAVTGSVQLKRLINMLLTGFALTALLLAAIGTYGVMSLNVSSRINEFGIRMALGAQPGDVLRDVVGHGILLAGIGVVIGLAGAFWLTRYLETLLFKVKTTDPIVFIGVAMLLGLVAMMACYIPARRATRVDPMIALRYE